MPRTQIQKTYTQTQCPCFIICYQSNLLLCISVTYYRIQYIVFIKVNWQYIRSHCDWRHTISPASFLQDMNNIGTKEQLYGRAYVVVCVRVRREDLYMPSPITRDSIGI